ncbi:hypothetical protein [uncultured Gimesia sp.]|uniref:hypothetical protein n=1 Tax=uncultured Gimesia sp. TaxID=1678688 RepID=UPI002602FD46|nr:hypothetical protein [uncultured Gimesia sp.]
MTQNQFQNTSGPLPGERDFDPYDGDLDAQSAWRNFGGLTLAEAYRKFLEHPGAYSEDFMWMGGKAFVYYFPVLERYLLVTPVWSEENGSEWCQILGLGSPIQCQFTEDCLPEVRELVPRVMALITHVRDAIDVYVSSGHPYYSNPEIHQHVSEEWDQLEQHLQKFEDG